MEQDLITNLPHEVLVLISRFLSAKDLGSLAQCCRFLRFFLFANEVWTPLLSSTFPLLETDPQLDARAQYKLFLQYGKNFRRGKVRVRMIGQPHLVRGREETVFCAKNLLKNTFVSGGSVPVVTVSDISTGNKKFEFNFQSGLAMGLDIDSGLFACGGFQGSVSIVHGMDSDMQRFLHVKQYGIVFLFLIFHLLFQRINLRGNSSLNWHNESEDGKILTKRLI